MKAFARCACTTVKYLVMLAGTLFIACNLIKLVLA